MGIYNSFYKWTVQDIKGVIHDLDMGKEFTEADVINKIRKQYAAVSIGNYYPNLSKALYEMVLDNTLNNSLISTAKTDGSITETLYSWK